MRSSREGWRAPGKHPAGSTRWGAEAEASTSGPRAPRFNRRAFLQRLGAVAPAIAISLAAAEQRAHEIATKAPEVARVDQVPSASVPPTAPREPEDFRDLLAARPAAPSRGGGRRRESVMPANRALAYQNPVVAENCPDPHVLNDDGSFYMVSTSHFLPAFPIRYSEDLVHWEETGAHVFTQANRPKWARDHFWAPELHRVGEKYVCYYTARSRITRRLCIGAATAEGPLGPYHDIGRPLVSTAVTVLDPTYFHDDDGRHYLYWKADAAEGDPSGPICVQELAADGLSLVGERWEVLTNDLTWEGRLIEGPSVIKRNGYYYLFYSGSAFNTAQYAIGVARSTSPIGGFEKHGGPVLRGTTRWHGPGHNSIVSHQGHDYIVYHAWEGERFENVRPGLIDHITWSDRGWPVIGEGHPREAWEPYIEP